ncbi:hypothetical protein VNO78_23388 [Psophocarpus tetragonolobus]|uniref:SKP1 component POZ domain-containing protein n=1 Tax=Psophocarpus tetragonolobus TaxID=3891 RepID=A0AAN9S424_PSOTE
MMKLAIQKEEELKNLVEALITKEMETVQLFTNECIPDPSKVISLHNVSGRTLFHIIRYCSKHLCLARDGDINDMKEFDKRFVMALSVYKMKNWFLLPIIST